MKNPKIISTVILVCTLLFMASCEAIGTIFKAGMGFGIFIVIAIIVLIVGLLMRAGKK